MNECDHIVGLEYCENDTPIIRTSINYYGLDYKFMYCPDCGYKFTCHDKGIGHGFGLSGICIDCGEKLNESI